MKVSISEVNAREVNTSEGNISEGNASDGEGLQRPSAESSLLPSPPFLCQSPPFQV